MSEEDFACDKFLPQKWRADVCRNCYQPLRLHNKKQAKHGAEPAAAAAAAASNGAPSDSLSNSLRPLGAKATRGGPSPSPSKPKEEKETKDTIGKSLSGSPFKQKAVKTRNPDSGVSQKFPPANEPKKTGAEKLGSSLKPATSSSSRPITTSKSSSLLPAKPPPPPAASCKRNSLPRIPAGVPSKPPEPRLLSPKKPPLSMAELSSTQKEISTSKVAPPVLADAGLNQEQPSVEVAKGTDKEPQPLENGVKSSVVSPVPDEVKKTVPEEIKEKSEVVEDVPQRNSEKNLVASEERKGSHFNQTTANTEAVVEVVTEKESDKDELGNETQVETMSPVTELASTTDDVSGSPPEAVAEKEKVGQGAELNETKVSQEIPADRNVPCLEEGVADTGKNVVATTQPGEDAEQFVENGVEEEQLRQEESGDSSQEVGISGPPFVTEITHGSGDIHEDNLQQEVMNKPLHASSLSGDIPSTQSSGEEPVVSHVESISADNESSSHAPSDVQPGAEQQFDSSETSLLSGGESDFKGTAASDLSSSLSADIGDQPSLQESVVHPPVEDSQPESDNSALKEEGLVEVTEKTPSVQSADPTSVKSEGPPPLDAASSSYSNAMPAVLAIPDETLQPSDQELMPSLPLLDQESTPPDQESIPPDQESTPLPPPPDQEFTSPDQESTPLPPPPDQECTPPDQESTPLPPPPDQESTLPDQESTPLPPPPDQESTLPDQESTPLPPPPDQDPMPPLPPPDHESTPPPPPPLPSPPPGDMDISAEHVPVPIPPPVSFSGAAPPPPPPPPPIQAPSQPWNASPRPQRAKPEGASAPNSTRSATPTSREQNPASSAHAATMSLIREGGVSLRKVERPVPNSTRSATPTSREQNPASSAHAASMSLIREGGVSLRKVERPVERAVGEEKVVDFASEMRQKLRNRKKEETKSESGQLEEKREEVKKVAELLRGACNTRSYLHQLLTLLAKVDQLLQSVGHSEEKLHRYLQWPTHLVASLRRMVKLMQHLEENVVAVEKLSQQLVACNKPALAGASADDTAASVGVVSVVQIDSEAVDLAITGILAVAGKIQNVSQLQQPFPVFEHDIERPLHRASQAMVPIMELLYQKAFNVYDSIYLPSVSKFDRKFRVQNAIRLLKICGLLSDGLCSHLNIARHRDYSQVQLRKKELEENFKDSILKAANREGEWDTDETVVLVKSGSISKGCGAKSNDELCESVMAGLEGGGVTQELREALTPETFSRIEKAVVASVLSKHDDKLVEAAIALTREVYGNDSVSCHRCDYDWLYELVMKANHDRVRHLVTTCDVNINAKSSDVGNSVLHKAVSKKDLATVAFLVRLGADPLLVNNRQHSPVQQLGIKCFPSIPIAANITEKDPLFNLSAYINSPSLSDVVLVAEDGKRFHGHRLVLCAQSPVFKTMLDSDLWAASRDKEAPLPTMSGRVLELLLNYLYTGSCLFPRDDLMLGLDLLAAADQFLLLELKQLCQQILAAKIDAEVVIPMYYAAARYNSAHLVSSCAHYLCCHYGEVEDSNHEALLHLLDDTTSQPR